MDVGLRLTFENFGERVAEVRKGGAVEADLRGLSRTVKGTKTHASGNAVDDCLGDLNAGFAVLAGDGESQVDDVGLYSLDSHMYDPFLQCAPV